MRRLRAFVGIFGLLLAIFGLIILTQNKLTDMSSVLRQPPSMAYVPESEKIRPWFLGFHAAFADFLWIKTTIYFGSHLLGDQQYPWLVKMVDMVTRFNPYFYPAYEFGGLVLPEISHNPNAGRIILERGICVRLEKKWKLYFYLGMLYYKYFDDYMRAAVYIATAAQLPGAPVEKLSGIAESMFKKSAGYGQDEHFMQFMYATSENPEVQRYLKNKFRAPLGR
jgi:hypothetical protein